MSKFINFTRFLAVIALLLPPLLTVAQGKTKTELLEAFMGTMAYEIPSKGVEVEYKFAKPEKPYLRTADGKQTFLRLLQDNDYFDNRKSDGAVEYVAVNKRPLAVPGYADESQTNVNTSPDRKRVNVESQRPGAVRDERDLNPPKRESNSGARDYGYYDGPEPGTGDPMRRNRNPGNGNQTGNGGNRWFSNSRPLPDSIDIAEDFEDMKNTVGGFKEMVWQYAAPVWGVVMYIFNGALVFLICLGGLLRYMAKTAANESMVSLYGRTMFGRWALSVHQSTAAGLLFVTWIIAIVLLIDIFLWLIHLGLPIWLMVVIWFPVLWFAEWLTNWVVPDVRVAGRN